MKAKLTILLLLCYAVSLNAQTPWWKDNINNPNVPINQIRDSAEAWFKANPGLPTGEDEEHERFEKWELFWRDRLVAPNINSTVADANKKMMSTLMALPVCTTGGAWKHIGPFSTQYAANQGTNNLCKVGWVNAICVVPSTNVVYVGTPYGGIWKTNNALPSGYNPTWTCVTATYPFFGLGISSIVCNSSGTKVYAATGGTKSYGMGLIQSTNSGSTWSQAPAPLDFNVTSPQIVKKLIIHPANDNVLFAMTSTEVFTTTNGGTSWTALSFPDNTAQLDDIEFMPGSQTDVIVGGKKLYKYSGGTWINITANLTSSIFSTLRVDVVGSNIYCLYGTSASNVRYDKSTNNGTSFTLKGNTADITVATFPFEVNDLNEDIFYTEGGFSFERQVTKFFNISTNTWVECSNYRANQTPLSTHGDIRCINIIRSTPTGMDDVLYVGCDGGILYAEDSDPTTGKTTFINITGTGLEIAQFYGISSPERNVNVVSGGTQDNDMFVGIAGGTYNTYPVTVPTDWPGTDAYESAFDRLDPTKFYCERGNSVSVFTTNGNFGTALSIPNRTEFPKVLATDVNNNVYHSNQHLFKVDPVTTTQTTLTSTLSNWSCKNIRAYNINEKDPNVVYVAFGTPTWNHNIASCDECAGACPTCSGGACLSKRLYKSTNAQSGSPTWTDITASMALANGGPDGPRWLEMSDIATDFEDPNKVWVSFSGFWEDGSGVPICRVAYSSNGGSTFTDYSTGLPNCPVNVLKFEPGGSGRIWAGTDAGVYYRDPGGSWQCYNYSLPICVVKDLDILKCGGVGAGIIRAATHGYGIWEASLPSSSTPDINISGSVTWNDSKQIYNDIHILNGAVLTIPAGKIIQIHKKNKIVIERGGKLIINGATLTDLCGEMWKGIEVWGNSSLNQLTVTNQGQLIINSGSVIENALTGAQACRRDASNNEVAGYAGGIIECTSGTFRNCQRDVYLAPYQNMNGMLEVANISDFTLTTFITNSQLKNSLTPTNHIELNGVKGIAIKGCSFSNSATGVYSPLNRGRGISATNSSFLVLIYCSVGTIPCPGPNTTRNTFTNLHYGIYATGTSTTPKHSVNKADFTNCWFGAFSSAINYVEYTENKFDNAGTPGNSPPTPNKKYGLYLENCTGYKVEENGFKATAPGTSPAITGTNLGLYITNSGTANNLVYNNTFNKLYVGATAHGNNRNSTGSTGLVFKCNDFTQCPFDISVVTPTSPPVTFPGIAQNQGTTGAINTNPAGNTFTNTSHTADYSNCTTCQAILYRMHASPVAAQGVAPTIRPYDNVGSITVSTVAGTTYTKSGACPSTLDGGGGTGGSGFRAMITNETTNRDAAKSDYESALDGGNTQTLISQVSAVAPSSAYDVYLSLKESPGLLSDTVLVAAASKEYALPDVLVKDILLDNPQAARNEKVLDTLRNRATPMDEEDITDIVISSQDNVSPIEDKLSVVSDYDNRRSYAVNRLITYNIDNENTDSTIAILSNEASPSYKYDLVETRLKNNDIASAESTVDNIETNNPQDAYEYNAYQQLYPLLKYQKENSKYITDIDSTQAESLRTIIQNYPNTRASIIAQNILRAATDDEYPEIIILPEVTPEAKKINIKKPKELLKLYPNPAKGWFTIEYNLTEVGSFNKAEAIITDINGITVKTIRLTKGSNRIVANVDMAPIGIYFVKVAVDDKVKATSKIILE